jgi:uncharacterized lipoprotein
MKKVILAAALVITLASCGNSKTEATATDSTAVSLDTTAVSATDTTVSEIPSNQLEAPKAEADVK